MFHFHQYPAGNAALEATAEGGASVAAAVMASAPGAMGAAPGGLAPPGNIPQMVVTSGQVSEGVQGAQLLIPTSQGEQR